MLNSKGEDFYAHQYWEFIKAKVSELIDYPTILDLGSGQGRLSVLLANKLPKAKVISTDISDGAITALRVVAAERGLTNIEAESRSISEVLSNTNPNSIDLILLTEVSFCYPAWREDLPNILMALKPGGFLLAPTGLDISTFFYYRDLRDMLQLEVYLLSQLGDCSVLHR